MPLKQCCAREAHNSLKKHLSIATCDGCGRLLLAYGDEATFQLTVDEFEARDVEFDQDRHGKLWVVSKVR